MFLSLASRFEWVAVEGWSKHKLQKQEQGWGILTKELPEHLMHFKNFWSVNFNTVWVRIKFQSIEDKLYGTTKTIIKYPP